MSKKRISKFMSYLSPFMERATCEVNKKELIQHSSLKEKVAAGFSLRKIAIKLPVFFQSRGYLTHLKLVLLKLKNISSKLSFKTNLKSKNQSIEFCKKT